MTETDTKNDAAAGDSIVVIGGYVRVVNLVSASQYNGKIGRVCMEFNRESGRYQVRRASWKQQEETPYSSSH